MDAVENENMEIVDKLIKYNADVNIRNNENKAAITFALNTGNYEICSLLINVGAIVKRNEIEKIDEAFLNIPLLALLFENYGKYKELEDLFLDLAVSIGHFEIAHNIISKREKNIKFYTSLLGISASKGYVDIVKLLLEHGANINSSNIITSRGVMPALIRAINANKEEVVKVLLSQGADVNIFDPLMYAAEIGNIEIVKFLIKYGANIRCRDYQYTPLLKASEKGYEDVVKLLLDIGCNYNDSNSYGHTAVLLAAYNGHTNIVKLFLERGISVDWENKNGCTLLMAATIKSRMDVIKLLINKGVNINKLSKSGHTALSVAIESKNEEAVELLLENGADANKKSNNNFGFYEDDPDLINVNSSINDLVIYTPLIIAIDTGLKEVVKLLIKYKADINLKNASNNTPLMHALICRKFEMASLIISCKEKLNCWDYTYDVAALVEAAGVGSLELTKKLLSAPINGINIDSRNIYNCTALSKAIMSKQLDMVKYLIENGADIEKPIIHKYIDNTPYGTRFISKVVSFSPLMEAAKVGSLSIMQVLIENGANLSFKNNENNTVYNFNRNPQVNLFLNKLKTFYNENVGDITLRRILGQTICNGINGNIRFIDIVPRYTKVKEESSVLLGISAYLNDFIPDKYSKKLVIHPFKSEIKSWVEEIELNALSELKVTPKLGGWHLP
ncbi:ankyrin repeat domain-containing protein [Holosporaceae bacterium 'Namur']|nr:ankyrin repeat domain-containing protein [Holosporaceae bacterium 'Namur']